MCLAPVAGSIESPKLAISLALRFCLLAGWMDTEVLNEPPGMVLQLPPGKAGFFRDDSHLQLFQEGRRSLKRRNGLNIG
jgi:hypothetical protein